MKPWKRYDDKAENEELTKKIEENDVTNKDFPEMTNRQFGRVVELTFLSLFEQIEKLKKEAGISKSIFDIGTWEWLSKIVKELNGRLLIGKPDYRAIAIMTAWIHGWAEDNNALNDITKPALEHMINQCGLQGVINKGNKYCHECGRPLSEKRYKESKGKCLWCDTEDKENDKTN